MTDSKFILRQNLKRGPREKKTRTDWKSVLLNPGQVFTALQGNIRIGGSCCFATYTRLWRGETERLIRTLDPEANFLVLRKFHGIFGFGKWGVSA